MAKRNKSAGSASGSASSLDAALEESSIIREEDYSEVQPFLSSSHNEHGPMRIWARSTMARTLSKSCYPFYLYSISVGLVPPFSEFFYAILEHY